MILEQLIKLRERTDNWDQVVLSPEDFALLVDSLAISKSCPVCHADPGCSCDSFQLENRHALFHIERIQAVQHSLSIPVA